MSTSTSNNFRPARAYKNRRRGFNSRSEKRLDEEKRNRRKAGFVTNVQKRLRKEKDEKRSYVNYIKDWEKQDA